MQVTTDRFTKMQLELLKLFSTDIPDDEVQDIKRLIARYYAEKLTAVGDKVWEEKGWSDEDVEKMLHTRMRTPYTP